jgi:hypothetical protein
VPAQAGADTSGAYFTNFSSDLATQFDGASQFYIQWRQRFSPEMLANKWAGGGGFKSLIVTTGDQPGRVFSSCEAIGIVQTNYYQNGFPTLYDSCTGSASHGPYDNFFENVGSPHRLLAAERIMPRRAVCIRSEPSHCAGRQLLATSPTSGYLPDGLRSGQTRTVTSSGATSRFGLPAKASPRAGDPAPGNLTAGPPSATTSASARSG